MLSYSIPGYLSLLRFRGRRTWLIEGETDRKVLAAAILQMVKAGRIAEPPILDTSDIVAVSGPAGRREIVEFVHAEVLRANLFALALVDRENRPSSLSLEESPALGLYWTRGHSIENYLVEGDSIVRFVEQQFPELATPQWSSKFLRVLPRVFLWAYGLTVAAYSHRLVTRIEGILDESAWRGDESLEVVPAGVVNTLVSRGISRTVSDQFLADAAAQSGAVPAEQARWDAHGHLVWQCAWTAAGATLIDMGANANASAQVARGMRDVKLRFLADTWALALLKREPIPLAEAWEQLM